MIFIQFVWRAVRSIVLILIVMVLIFDLLPAVLDAARAASLT